MQNDEKLVPRKLLIVFVKNTKRGKVKTRLAASIGNKEAVLVYNQLIDITEAATVRLSIDRAIYYSDFLDESRWLSDAKMVQTGSDLGQRMKNAFGDGFDGGYEQIVLIGSDLPDISVEIIEEAFAKLETRDVVFGPANDGGYYLVGLTKQQPSIFANKPWSQPNLLALTLDELDKQNVGYVLLNTYNDVDTFEDLKKSSLYTEYIKNKAHND